MAGNGGLSDHVLTIFGGCHTLKFFKNFAHNHAALNHVLLGFVEIIVPFWLNSSCSDCLADSINSLAWRCRWSDLSFCGEADAGMELVP